MLYHEWTIEIEKSVLDVRQMIIHLKNEGCYEALITCMIKIIGFKKHIETDLLQQEKFTKEVLDQTVQKIDITFSDTIQWLMEDPTEFFRFAYHLKIKESGG